MLETAGANPPHFPMPVEKFLSNTVLHLQRGDILLSRSPTFASRMIRFLSGSFFSHAAMVFLVPHQEEGFDSTFVIESLFQGVGLAALDKYVDGRHPVEEVGVLRLEGPEFTETYFRLARGILLDELHRPYDYHRLFSIALNVLFGLNLAARKAGRKPALYRRWMPRQFICSGFIQFGLYKAAAQMGLDTRKVILKSGMGGLNEDQMLAVTPEDVATSDKLRWQYVIRRGWVYRAENFAAAKDLISGARR